MAGEVKFYMDEHVPPAVTHGLRLRGIDVLTTKEAGMLGASDEAQLRLAAGQGGVLFSQDEDFLALHRQGVSHAGIAMLLSRRPSALSCAASCSSTMFSPPRTCAGG
jgi:predicted nuclease of predicted toxin-antitoxin system